MPNHATPTEPMPSVGQIYRSCDPADNGTRIRVVEVTLASGWVTRGPGHGKVRVVRLNPDGSRGRPRYMACTELHPTATTRMGVPRRTGYALEDAR